MTTGFFDSCRIQTDGIACTLPSDVLRFLSEDAILVDIRSELETEIRAFGLQKVVYLPHDQFEEKWKKLPLDHPLILADAVGIWSKHFAKFLKSQGIGNVASLAGGIADWEKDGYPMKAGKYEPLNGPCPCMITPKSRETWHSTESGASI